MMPKKQSRWQETHRPTQKTGGREPAALAVSVCSGGKRAGSSTSKASVSCGRSSSGSDSAAGGSLRRGSLGHQGCAGHQSSRRASRPARPALGLCSSRSFSSLHTSPLAAAAPFMRSSRSLSRLDQRATRDDSDHAVPRSRVKKGQTTEKKAQLSSSEERIRDNIDQCQGDNAKKMKTSSSCKPPQSSSSLLPTSECLHRCDKVKKPTRDGVNTLCAMTSGMRRNWVQAVLKNVRPGAAPDVSSSLSEQRPDPPSTEGLNVPEHPDSFLREHETSDGAEESHRQPAEQEVKLQPASEPSPAGGSASSTISPSHLHPPISPSASSALSPIGAPQQAEEGDGASCHQCDGSTATAVVANDGCTDEHYLNMRSEVEQVKAAPQSETQQPSLSVRCECAKAGEKLPCEQQTGQLVKELEQTQKELSRLQQLNRNLQEELQRERERVSVHPQSDHLSNGDSSPGQALALQRLQKINRDLRSELEARKTSQEEAREAELRRRVDLLAQQAQLLVTGDATALAQAHLEQDRRRFHEQHMELERRVASLKSQLSVSEEQRREAASRLAQMQQELQSFHSLRQEADRLQTHLQEVTSQLLANEEAQAQKEARLQKHLMLLQASQDRERRSLAAGLTQAEQRSQDLQERLDRAEQQVGSLNKTQTCTREIEKAQQQLQEELACTVSAVQKLQEERERLDRRCEELHNQLSEADGEVSRLQSRLKTDETHYYNLEHSYERVCEELQVALGKVQQRESDTQDMREGYERLLDRKEQELSEVLLKMEVLGNSLEETEVKLNEVLKVCTCSSSSQLKDESSEPAQQQTTHILTVNDSRPKARDSDHLSNGSVAAEHARTRSRSTEPSYQSVVTAGDDPERVMSVIQILETKLYVTEEKLRDIMQRLEEHQGHVSCQDPQLCSQLTRSRATAQHLSLLLHSRAKQSQRFAQETENRCRMLVGRFQVALNITQACRERLQATPINIADLEKQLASVAACLQQGEKDAEKQQHKSRNASKGEDKILNDETIAGVESDVSAKSELSNALPSEDDMANVGKCLMRELFVVEKMVSALQSQHGQLSLVPRDDEEGAASRYKRIISQRIALKIEERTGRETCDNCEPLERVISRVCAEAELIYAALKFQQQYQSVTQVNKQQAEHQRVELADVNPPELAPYEEQVQVEGRGLDGAAKPGEKVERDVRRPQAEKDWSERLLSRLQKRAKCLRQLCQEISDGDGVECRLDDDWENSSAADVSRMQEQAKLTYLSDRLLLDSEQELQQSEALQDKLRALCKEQDITIKDEQEAFNRTICQLQEDNSVLRGELERAKQKITSVEAGNQRLLEDIRKIESYHEERMERLEAEFHRKIRELQQIHEEEVKHLHGYYTQSTYAEAPAFADRTSSLSDQTEMDWKTKEELGSRMAGGDAAAMREAHQRALAKLEASCGEGFTAMEEMHRQLIGDLKQQHQQEVAALLKEKDQLLQEETAATMAAIVAMRRAHKQALEKSRQSQHIRESADISQLHTEHEKEIQLLHEELEVLSAQHTQTCLDNSRLIQQLQAERQSLTQHQKENQELKEKQRGTKETCPDEKQTHAALQVNNFYEMEVILRAREAEMQFLRQEARSLREELKVARMDKLYAQNKLKVLYTNIQDEPYHDANELCVDFKSATWSPGRDAAGQPASLEDTVTNTSHAAFLKRTEKSSLTRQIRGGRSKSLKEGLSAQERMKLFESF